MNEFNNKKILITGSTSGIGYAIASAFAKNGSTIFVNGLVSKDESQKVCEQLRELGAKDAVFFDTDLRSPQAITKLMDDIEQNHSGADIVVNNAGMQKTMSITEVSSDFWADVIAVNLSAAFYIMQRALPIMKDKGYGRVINIASVHGLVASKDKAPYVSSKFGLIGLTRVAALEYAQFSNAEQGGITVNAICPGWTETTLIEPQILARAEMFGGERELGIKDLLKEKQPSMRTSDPSELGHIALFLSAKSSHNITGISLPIDGGWTAQ